MKNKSLFNLDNWNESDVINIIKEALEFKTRKKKVDYKQQKVVANLFFEPSTRTHYSFDIAANRLGCKTINFNEQFSSTKKGESLYDTIKTFEAIGVDALVIRHPQNNYYDELVNINVPILNGGDGSGNHPTQSLLDLLTIWEEYGKFEGLNVLLVGDIKYSRVAKTNIKIMQKLGMNVKISCIEQLAADCDVEIIDFDKALPNMDVVMLLRYQFERHRSNEKYHLDYLKNLKLNSKREQTMKENAIIMHPAPFNRGIEIDDEIVECQKSRIFKQMENGIYVRMALLHRALGEAE